MGLGKEFMADIYRAMTNEELLSTATNDIRDLTPEALEALNEELVSRRLKDKVADAMNIQQQSMPVEEFLQYVDLLRQLPCPLCSGTDKLLNGASFAKIVTAIVFSTTHNEFIIACPDCLKKEFDRSGGIAMAFGVTEMIKGAIETLRVTTANNKRMSQVNAELPSEDLLYFVEKKIGEIKLYQDNRPKLEELIRYANSAFA
jgi:hypothetical protein